MSPTPSGRKLGQLERLPVSELRGVGNRKRAALESMGISTVLDLLTHYPRRYADRTNAVSIAELVPGDVGVVSATVRRVCAPAPAGPAPIVEAASRRRHRRARVTFFNQPWRDPAAAEGHEVALFGRVDRYRSALQMANPVVEVIGRRARQTGRIVPIYRQSERRGDSSIELARYVRRGARAGRASSPTRSPRPGAPQLG